MKSQAEIIPAILVDSGQSAMEKVNMVSPHIRWVQLDVCDGKFVESVSWGEPDKLGEYIKGVFVEVHLMVENPENVIDKWVKSGAKRIYIHYESTDRHREILKRIKDGGVETGIALLPDTPVDVVAEMYEDIDCVLLFSGNLGHYGGEFLQEPTLTKISTLQKNYKDIIIEVDGGVNLEIARMIHQRGVTNIVSGGYIFKSDSPVDSIENLKNAVDN